MKPLFAADLPAVAVADPRATLSVEPCLVTAKHEGKTIAASSCVLRLDTEAGPVYLFPRADIAADLVETGRVTKTGAAVWSIRARCGARKLAAFSAPVEGAAQERLAFDPSVVEISAAPSRGREVYRMM